MTLAEIVALFPTNHVIGNFNLLGEREQEIMAKILQGFIDFGDPGEMAVDFWNKALMVTDNDQITYKIKLERV